MAQRWCTSQFGGDRALGARILKHYRSEKNIAILKSLLGDLATVEATLTDQDGLVYRKKRFPVRIAAYLSLVKLGVEVEKPLVDILLEGREAPDPFEAIENR